MFIAGLFIFCLAIRKLTATILPSSDTITVFEYHPEGDNFMAVATKTKRSAENGEENDRLPNQQNFWL